MSFSNKVLKHLLCYFEICDHTIPHGPYRDDISGRSTKHFLGIFANRFDIIGHFIDGDD